jgi:hypothetical protein
MFVMFESKSLSYLAVVLAICSVVSHICCSSESVLPKAHPATFQALCEEQQEQSQIFLRLGKINYEGGHGVEKDFAKALAAFTQASKSSSESIRIEATCYLGYLNYYGGHGITQDHHQAETYFEQVSNQSNDLEMKAAAQKLLEQLIKRRMANSSIRNNNSCEPKYYGQGPLATLF